VQAEKKSFGLLQAVSLTTAVADTMEQQRVGGIRIIQVGIAVKFVGVMLLKNPQRGKYFRVIAEVWIDGESLGEKLKGEKDWLTMLE
jgi:hypothetical protein